MGRDRSDIAWRYLLWSAAFNLGTLSALVATTRLRARGRLRPAVQPRAFHTGAQTRGWDIAPGESLLPNGERDLVLEASLESFPASDPPAVTAHP
jgi:hypothetical protein